MQFSVISTACNVRPRKVQRNTAAIRQQKIALISANTIQIALWHKCAERFQLSLESYTSIEEFKSRRCFKTSSSQAIFVEVGFGELMRTNPTASYLGAAGYKNVFPIAEHCVPEDAIKFARFLYKWQKLSNS